MKLPRLVILLALALAGVTVSSASCPRNARADISGHPCDPPSSATPTSTTTLPYRTPWPASTGTPTARSRRSPALRFRSAARARRRAALAGRHPALQRRTLPARGRRRQQPDLGTATRLQRRTPAGRRSCVLGWRRTAQHRRLGQPRVRRQRRRERTQHHRIHPCPERHPCTHCQARPSRCPPARVQMTCCSTPRATSSSSISTTPRRSRASTFVTMACSSPPPARPSRRKERDRSARSSGRPTRHSCSSATPTVVRATERSRSSWRAAARVSWPRSARPRSPIFRQLPVRGIGAHIRRQMSFEGWRHTSHKKLRGKNPKQRSAPTSTITGTRNAGLKSGSFCHCSRIEPMKVSR